ncbi:MAG: glutamate-5-semialdehyde dehydrogenase [Nitrospinota bacterium]
MTVKAEQEVGALVRAMAEGARRAVRALRCLSTEVKNRALHAMAERLVGGADPLLAANAEDLARARERGLSGALVDRLLLNPDRIARMADGIRQVATLPDPVGEVTRMWRRPNGLQIGRVRVPIGVVGLIYESRPNVTADAAALCLKSGNAVLLRGGSEALASNRAIASLLDEAAAEAGAPSGAIQLVPVPDRAAVREMLQLGGLVDLIVPRGGESLVREVVERARVPILMHYKGVCHIYVDERADLAMAEAIAVNAKAQRPGVCNAMETLLVHEKVADAFLPSLCRAMREKGVELRGCAGTRARVPHVEPAAEEDWSAEYLDLILSIRVVPSFEAALDHIATYGSGLSEAIVTEDRGAALRFLREVDSAAVYVNASTRFTDGYEYGLGAELGISTDRLHARGPVGLEELTTYKYIVYGHGQLRS